MLIVEDGNGRIDANSYSSIASLDAYHRARGNSDWIEASASEKDIAAISATDYIDMKYRSRFRGEVINRSQALCWPRRGATVDGSGEIYMVPNVGAAIDGYLIDEHEIPKELTRAHAEASLRALKGKLLPDLKANSGAVSSVTVGPIAKTFIQGQQRALPTYPMIENLISPLLKSGGSTVFELVRS